MYHTLQLHTLSLFAQGATSPFLCIVLALHLMAASGQPCAEELCLLSLQVVVWFHLFHLTPNLSKYLSAFPLNPILIPTRVALEVPIWTARAPIRLTLESARCPCSSFVPGNVGYESLLLASCFPPVLELITGLKQQLGEWRCWQLRGGAALII